jgi:uncharacterized membrane protein YhfC
MVPINNIIALAVSGIGCFIIPILAFILVRRKSKDIFGALIAGVFAFFIPQMLIRVPLLQMVLPGMDWFVNLPNNIILYALFLGFTAGLFETAGRYLTLKLFIKEKTSYYAGISHGIGHGGIEAILIVGINALVYVLYAFMINNGTFDAMIDASAAAAGAQGELAAAQMNLLKNILIEGSPGMTLLGLLERFLVFFVHIGLSLMVAEGITKGKGILYSGYALLIHCVLDTSAVLMVSAGWNALVIEGVVALFAIGLIVYIITSKKRFAAIDKIYPVEKEQPMLDSDY